MVERFGQLGADVARGLAVRHDWGSQYRSVHFQGSLRWLGIVDDPAYVGEPETNGCAERWIKTLKEQCLWARLYEGLDDPPGGGQVRPDLQHRVAHPAPRACHPEGEVPRQPQRRGGVIVMEAVQGTGC